MGNTSWGGIYNLGVEKEKGTGQKTGETGKKKKMSKRRRRNPDETESQKKRGRMTEGPQCVTPQYKPSVPRVTERKRQLRI